MNRCSVFGGILFAAMTAAGVAQAGTTEAPADPAATAAPAAPAPEARKADPRVDDFSCKYYQETGTRLGKHKVCRTRQEWATIEREAQQRTSGMQNKNLSTHGQ